MIRNAAAVAGVGEKMPTTSTLQNANKQLETLTRKVSSRLPKIVHTSELSGIFRVVVSYPLWCVVNVSQGYLS